MWKHKVSSGSDKTCNDAGGNITEVIDHECVQQCMAPGKRD